MNPFKPISAQLLCSIALACCLISTGCFNRGRQFARGELRVAAGETFALRDRNGASVILTSGEAELNYQDQGTTRTTSLFVLRTINPDRGVLLEVPTSAFLTEANFRIPGHRIRQNYDLGVNRETEFLGSNEAQETDSCTAPGFCNHTSICTRTDSRGMSETYSCSEYGYYSACPGNKDVLVRYDHYIDHFFVNFLRQNQDQTPAAQYRGNGDPYSNRVHLRDLSSCRT